MDILFQALFHRTMCYFIQLSLSVLYSIIYQTLYLGYITLGCTYYFYGLLPFVRHYLVLHHYLDMSVHLLSYWLSPKVPTTVTIL